MSPKNFLLDDRLHAYIAAHTTAVDEVAGELITETAALGGVAGMQISPEQGALMALLTRAIGASNAIEIGTFTGFSALCIARALPPAPQGRLLCCDISTEWTSIGERYWDRAGVSDRIELRLGPAAETLRALPNEEQFDIGFIDADKEGYRTYYQELLPRMHPNGLILVDNVLWSGAVADESSTGETVEEIRGFNDLVAADPRVESTILTVADGLTIIRRL